MHKTWVCPCICCQKTNICGAATYVKKSNIPSTEKSPPVSTPCLLPQMHCSSNFFAILWFLSDLELRELCRNGGARSVFSQDGPLSTRILWGSHLCGCDLLVLAAATHRRSVARLRCPHRWGFPGLGDSEKATLLLCVSVRVHVFLWWVCSRVPWSGCSGWFHRNSEDSFQSGFTSFMLTSSVWEPLPPILAHTCQFL